MKAHVEGPPACSLNTTATWCLEDAEYPAYEISHAIEYNYAGVATLYKVSSGLWSLTIYLGGVLTTKRGEGGRTP